MKFKMSWGARRTQGGKLLAREQPASLFIPYTHHFDQHTVGLIDGRMMQVIKIEGFRFETESAGVLAHNNAALNTLLKSQRRGYSVHTTLIRRKETVELSDSFPPGYASLLNHDWMEQFKHRDLFVNELYLVVIAELRTNTSSWLPPNGLGAVSHEEREQMLRELFQVTQGFMELMHDYGTRRLGTVTRTLRSGAQVACSEIMEYLSMIYNHDTRSCPIPDLPIREVLGTSTRLRFKHRTVVREGPSNLNIDYSALFSLVSYPADTWSGILNELLKLPNELIVTQSFLPIPPALARERLRLLYERSRTAGEPENVLDNIKEAVAQIAIGDAAYGMHHLTIECRGGNPRELEDRAAKLSHLFAEVGASVRREDVGTELVFWAQLPGNAADFIARGKPISTRNLAAMNSFHNYERGTYSGNHLGEALTVMTTPGDTPYYLNLHDGDLGNTCVFGKTGSGKTALIAFLIAQSQKYGGRTIVLDKDSSWEVYVRAEDGDYITMTPGTSTGINFLQLEVTHANTRFMVHMTELLIEQGLGRSLNVTEKERINRAIDTVCTLPLRERRMRILAQALYLEELAQALTPWIEGGPQGWILDAPEDTMSFEHRVTGIDIGWVLNDKSARAPVMMYLLHRMEESVNRPGMTRIVLEEGWRLLKDPALAHACEDWSRTVRKKGGITIFVSQSPTLESEVGRVLYEQSATKIYFPDHDADEGKYEALGLTPAQIDILRTAHPHERKVFIKHGNTATIIQAIMPLPGHLAVLAGNKDSVARMHALRKQYGHESAAWLPHFMKEYNHAKALVQ